MAERRRRTSCREPLIHPDPAFLDADQISESHPRSAPIPAPCPTSRAAPRALADVGGRAAAVAAQLRSRRALLVFLRPDAASRFPTAIRSSARPTSTLDWHGAGPAHTGEAFARIDHKPTGLFVKGVIGLGTINGGQDRGPRLPVRADQIFRHHQRRQGRQPDVRHVRRRLGLFAGAPASGSAVFAGYHYWREKVDRLWRASAMHRHVHQHRLSGRHRSDRLQYRRRCVYEPTVACLRASASKARSRSTDRWSVSGEIAAHPVRGVANQRQPSAAAKPG